MATFKIICPHCGQKLEVQDEWIDMIADCPSCKQQFVISRSETPDVSAKSSTDVPLSESTADDTSEQVNKTKHDGNTMHGNDISEAEAASENQGESKKQCCRIPLLGNFRVSRLARGKNICVFGGTLIVTCLITVIILIIFFPFGKTEAERLYDEFMSEDPNIDVMEQVKKLHKSAEMGYAPAQRELGAYYHGRSKFSDEQENKMKGTDWYRKAAEQGDVKAQLLLAYCYALGDGIPQNLAKAAFWFRKPAEQGNADAQHNVAISYAQGYGGVKDMRKAVEWYRKAAEQGLAESQFSLGICYEQGYGVNKDMEKAAEWYQKAAEQQHAKAQFSLAVCYTHGEGVVKDDNKAEYWFRKAAAQGLEEAQRVIRMVELLRARQ